MPRLVTKAELLWLVGHLEPTQTDAVTGHVPINLNSVYVRLRHLNRSGYLESERPTDTQGEPHVWRLTDAGRDRAADTELPDAETADFEAHFAGRDTEMDPLMVLEALSAEEGEWHTSSVVHEALPFSKQGIRKRLHNLKDEGLLELDPGDPGLAHQWRLTDAGRERLAEADAREGDPEAEPGAIDTAESP